MNKTTQSTLCIVNSALRIMHSALRIVHCALCIALAAQPAAAQQAESYIDAPRGAYIDTGFKPDSNSRVVMDVDVQGGGEYWFGTWNVAWNNGAFAVGNDGNEVYIGYGSGSSCGGTGNGSRVTNGRHTIDFDKGVFKVDGTVHTTRTGTFGQLNYNLYLFAQNRSGSAIPRGDQGTIRCYSCKIYDDGTLVRDFVPTDNPDVGFRDTVSGQFFGNSGSGTMLFTGNAPKKGTWTTSSWDGGFTPAAKNILLGKTPESTPASAAALINQRNGNTITEGSLTLGTLTDGDAGVRDKSRTTCLSDNASLTYSLGAASTIEEIRIYSTWSDTGRDTLSITSVAVETQDGETVMLSTSAITHSGNGNCACATLKMADDSPLCTNACKVVFNFGAQENGYVGYSELEVIVAEDVDIKLSGVIEIPTNENVTTNLTPADLSIWGPNGGNLTITGSGTVVTQNIPAIKSLDGIDFGSYWPWIEGVVTVENGAALESNTQLFRGSGVVDNNKRDLTRKLVVQSGATATFSPPSGDAYLVGLENSGYQNAWVVVTGTNSTLTLPANVYLSNRGDYGGHGGGLDILDGGHVEMGTFYVGYHCGTLRLNIDGGSLRTTGGIYGFKNGSRWTGATILFKDCVVETPFYKMAYPHGNGGSTVTFNGAVFTPTAGTTMGKIIDASPTGDTRCPHSVTGNGLIVDAPSGSSLEVSALLQGTGGFGKRGAGTVNLTAANTYTGTTTVEAGTLNITGALCGGLSVASNATCAVTLSAAPSAGAVSVAGTATFNTALTATSLSLPAGGTLTVTGIGSDVGSVSDYAGDFVIAGVSVWPKNSPIVSSSTPGFLEKIAVGLNASETVDAGYEFAIVNETSLQLVRAGIVNQTMTWTGAGSDTLWSTVGNWSNATRRIYSGDALVVAAGGDSTADLGDEVVLPTVRFNAGIAAHTISPAGASDSLKINTLVTNESASTQTFDLPVSIGEAAFTVYADGDVVFSNGLAAATGITPAVTKTGTGTLSIDGATWGGALDLREGAVALSGQTAGASVLSSVAGEITVNGLLDAGGAAVTLAETSPHILGTNAVLANGVFTYVPRGDYNYLDLDENQVLTLTNNATFTTTSALFENGTGNQRGVRVLDSSTLVFDTNGDIYISSKDNGVGNFLYASGGSAIVLSRGRTRIAWPNWAGRNGRMDIADGSFVSGGSIEFGWRASTSWFTLTDSVASFTDGLYLDVNANIDYAQSHMFVTRSVVTSGVWRVGNNVGRVHGSTELVFDDATLVPSKADTDALPYFLCTKPDCNQIRIQAGGLAVDSAYDVTINAPFVGAGAFTKLGEGAVTFLSTNSYAGATIVSNGTLRLIGRVAGAVQVAPGATLALPIPDQDNLPEVASLTVADGGSLALIGSGLPEGAVSVSLLASDGEIAIPQPQEPDAANCRFSVKRSNGRNILRYGKSVGLQIIVQ